MSKNVLILSGSPRKGGNSDILCDEFTRGAQDAGNEVEKIRVTEKRVAPCSACYYCREHGGECACKDDMADILQKMIDVNVIVLASPVYFYSINAQLKAVIDRTVTRWLEVKKEFSFSNIVIQSAINRLGAVVMMGKHLLAIFNNDPGVIATGYTRLSIVLSAYIFSMLYEVMSGYLRGFGISLVPALLTTIDMCGVSIAWIRFVFPKARPSPPSRPFTSSACPPRCC